MTILETKQVCMYFGGLKAVEQVDMQVEKGEIFGVIGPNGAGKTTDVYKRQLRNRSTCRWPPTASAVSTPW